MTGPNSKTEFSLYRRRVWVAGHTGMVGAAILRRLKTEGCDILTATSTELDLTRQGEVNKWLEIHKPEVVFLAAARVGGILVNSTYPADFIYRNLVIASNVIHAAQIHSVKKLLFMGSSSIYPRNAEQPIKETSLMTGTLEPADESYAIAKIAGLKMCQAFRKQYGCDFITAIPTNIYGPGDNFDDTSGHVIPGLMTRMHLAKLNSQPKVGIWGSGIPRREFIYVDDLADALVFVMQHYSTYEHINIGTGQDISIKELAQKIADVIGYRGELEFDASKPDGAPRKLLESSKLHSLGWRASTPFEKGLDTTYHWYREHDKTLGSAKAK